MTVCCLVALLEGDLSEVEALRDVKADLLSKKEVRVISYSMCVPNVIEVSRILRKNGPSSIITESSEC